MKRTITGHPVYPSLMVRIKNICINSTIIGLREDLGGSNSVLLDPYIREINLFLAVTFDFYRKWPLLRFIICSFNECGKGIYVFLFGLSWIYLENESVRIKKMEFS